MKHTDYQQDINFIRLEYENKFALKVETLKQKRKELHISQTQIATMAKCSLRKVQMFENHQSLDAFLLYVYQKHLETTKEFSTLATYNN